MTTDQQIEHEIQAKGLNAPRVHPDDIEAVIVREYYLNALEAVQCDYVEVSPELERLTLCMLVLRNGFVVTGESACIDIANYDMELGRKAARQSAVDKMWSLLGYALRDRLHGGQGAIEEPVRIRGNRPDRIIMDDTLNADDNGYVVGTGYVVNESCSNVVSASGAVDEVPDDDARHANHKE